MNPAAEDLRIDVARMIGDGPCAVRVTHLPSGTTVTVDDQDSTAANREVAVARIEEILRES
jgi:protein subunit release factor A